MLRCRRCPCSTIDSSAHFGLKCRTRGDGYRSELDTCETGHLVATVIRVTFVTYRAFFYRDFFIICSPSYKIYKMV